MNVRRDFSARTRYPFRWLALPGAIAMFWGVSIAQETAKIGPFVVLGLFLLLVSAHRRHRADQSGRL